MTCSGKWPKEDSRPPLNGWAGGDYACNCFGCGDEFIADKRCITCADCAYKKKDTDSELTEVWTI